VGSNVRTSCVLRFNLQSLGHRVDRVLGFFSSRPNWGPPPPLPQASVSPSFDSGGGGGGGAHLLGGDGVGVPIPTRGQVVLYV
jgi:hypothetical protein